MAGASDKEEASENLPMLNAIISYPTLIFIDRDGRVRKIHTGFAGPATDQYQEFKENFESTVNQLVNEKEVQ
ncbi:MAG: hypothetical protein R3350_01965 [Saprospiraceae bacterium]|nr:hypothetical protein [Saprospiraceae bacterium]